MLELTPTRAGFCGCDSDEVRASLISIDAALEIITKSVLPLSDHEQIALEDSLGRVLSQDITVRTNTPPFDNSAVDGYAVNTTALVGSGPWTLSVPDRVAAGQSPQIPVDGLVATRIFTGAPVPKGADAIVMQEDVTRSQSHITFSKHITAGQNLRRAGEDMTRGTVSVARGTCLSAFDIAAIAASGHGTVQVCRKLSIGLVITGDELRPAGAALNGGAIWDINTPMLRAAMTHPAITIAETRHVQDTQNAVSNALADLSTKVDLIVTSGGASVGEADHVKPALSALGGEVLFSGVAVKPGKPVSYGTLGAARWLGLPGNPQAAMLMWHLFGTALCHALMARTSPIARRRNVVTDQDLRHKPGRCELRLATIVGQDGFGRDVVRFAESTHSGRVGLLPQADGYLIIPAETDHLAQGALVEFQPLPNR